MAVAALSLALATSSLAIHDDDLFELGPLAPGVTDILGDEPDADLDTNGPDWADVFDANGDPVGLGDFGGVVAGFIEDDLSQKGLTDRTTFSGAGGSNKNNDPISTADCAAQTPPLTGSACDTWHWDGGNVPAKDDLANVYAYAAFNSLDQLILYIGLERLAPEGDSHIDVEFLQEEVALLDGAIVGTDGIPCDDPGRDVTPCEFDGFRTIEDVIVSMDYVTGGGIGEVSVRDWSGSEYVQVGVAAGEGCNTANTICAFNNGAAIDGGPWDNFDRGNAVIEDLPQNAFTEIGVNVTALLGDTPCISTVMAKTRSSASFTAELKDFAGPASFPICGAQIGIAADDVNAVGQSHTFTVSVEQKLGALTSPAPDGTDVDVTLTGANGASAVITANSCDTDNPDPASVAVPKANGTGTVNGTCAITFHSTTAGTITGSATATFTVGDEEKTVTTDGTGTNTGPAVKRFVDAKITIGPDDTNSIGENHTFTVNVLQDDGLLATEGGDGVTGFTAPADGTPVTVTLTDSLGSTFSTSANTCISGTSSGSCSITFTSPTAGTVIGNASTTFTLDGVSLTRDTDPATTSIGAGPGGSGPAEKDFVAGSLAWEKRQDSTTGALQGGAVFTVCRTHNLNTAPDPDTFVDITDVCVDVTDDEEAPAATPTSTNDQDTTAGEFSLTGLRLGRYTVVEKTPPAGYVADPDTITIELTLASPNGTIATPFVNERAVVKITAFGYTNTPQVTSPSPTSGIQSGIAVYTVKVKNYGDAPAALSNSSLSVVATGPGAAGVLACTDGNAATLTDNPMALTGNLAKAGEAGAELTFTLTCTYTDMADGAQIAATLNVKYTTGGTGERTASGSEALVRFTVQSD